MRRFSQHLKYAVAAFLSVAVLAGAAARGQERDLDDLFDALKSAEGAAAKAIEAKIFEEWSRSGSPAMDLLLSRGREALQEGDTARAIEHFSALIDHAPGFAEGYNARATAFYETEEFGLALTDIRRTLALNPRHFAAMSGLALIFEELDYPEGALAAWREVEAIHPNQENVSEAIERLEILVEGRTL